MRKELGKGSFSDIARPLSLWKQNEKYQPIIEQADLPDAFATRLTALGREMLEQARIEVTRERLAEYAAREEGAARERSTLDEALDRVEELEEELAALRLQVDRSRPGAETSPEPRPVLPDPPVAPDPDAPDLAGFVETVMGRKRARDAEAFWQDVRDAVEASMRRKGPMAVDGLFRALPDRLKARSAEVGLPLTPAWLRYHLVRMSEAGEGVAEIEGRFGLAPVVDEAADVQESAEADPLGKRPFWRMFVLRVHEILVEHGPLPAEDILARMPFELVLQTKRFQKITPGRLRYKLRVRIEENRPFEELSDGRFAAVTGEVPWDGEVPLSLMARTG